MTTDAPPSSPSSSWSRTRAPDPPERRPLPWSETECHQGPDVGDRTDHARSHQVHRPCSVSQGEVYGQHDEPPGRRGHGQPDIVAVERLDVYESPHQIES